VERPVKQSFTSTMKINFCSLSGTWTRARDNLSKCILTNEFVMQRRTMLGKSGWVLWELSRWWSRHYESQGATGAEICLTKTWIAYQFLGAGLPRRNKALILKLFYWPSKMLKVEIPSTGFRFRWKSKGFNRQIEMAELCCEEVGLWQICTGHGQNMLRHHSQSGAEVEVAGVGLQCAELKRAFYPTWNITWF
jgi:hypothetical protein